MSGEIALRESQPISSALEDDRGIRLEELRDLEQRLDAIKHLDGYNRAITYINEEAMAGRNYFLIAFDPAAKTVVVSPYSFYREGSYAYNSGEDLNSSRNVVLVEADRARDLKEAYPNYFLDVTAFLSECRMTLAGVRPDLDSIGDFSWLSSWRRPRGPRAK